MRKTFQRLVVMIAVLAATLGIAAGPAFAADTGVAVTWDGTGNSTLGVNPSSATINASDTVTIGYTSTAIDPTELDVYPAAGCTGGAPVLVPAGGSTVLTPAATATYSLQAVDVQTGFGSQCSDLAVTVNAAPPPVVPEVPYAAWMLVAAGALFGGGFLLLRRRANRLAA